MSLACLNLFTPDISLVTLLVGLPYNFYDISSDNSASNQIMIS